jgi:hypothetical protein
VKRLRLCGAGLSRGGGLLRGGIVATAVASPGVAVAETTADRQWPSVAGGAVVRLSVRGWLGRPTRVVAVVLVC